MLSNTCSCISRFVKTPVSSISLSASVDFPWSICAIIQKLRIFFYSSDKVKTSQILIISAIIIHQKGDFVNQILCDKIIFINIFYIQKRD